MSTSAALTFRELLDYTAAENLKWAEWFGGHPEALDVGFGEGHWETVRAVVCHVAFVEDRYASILTGRPVPTPGQAGREDAATVFAYVAECRSRFEQAVAHAEAEGLGRVIEFMTLTAGPQRATARKVVAHALLHGVRHWAQLATQLRVAGHASGWPHDLLVSKALV